MWKKPKAAHALFDITDQPNDPLARVADHPMQGGPELNWAAQEALAVPISLLILHEAGWLEDAPDREIGQSCQVVVDSPAEGLLDREQRTPSAAHCGIRLYGAQHHVAQNLTGPRNPGDQVDVAGRHTRWQVVLQPVPIHHLRVDQAGQQVLG